jgi:hypothetical protein
MDADRVKRMRENAREVGMSHISELVRDEYAELLWRALMLAPDVSTCDALLRGEDVPEDRLDIEERPWAEWGRSGKPITPTALARLLKPYRIKPKLEKINTKPVRGYEFADFVDAWARYLDAAPAVQPSSDRYPRYFGPTMRETGDPATVTDRDEVTVGNGKFPLNQAVVTPVTLETGVDGASPTPIPGDSGFPAFSDKAMFRGRITAEENSQRQRLHDVIVKAQVARAAREAA